jgi:hypothetical protein
MITHVINAGQSAWKTAKLTYHTVAFVGLLAWGVVLFAGTHSGYAQLTLPIGTAVAQADGEQLSKEAATMQKQIKQSQQQASVTPVPGHKRPIPPTPTQVQ